MRIKSLTYKNKIYNNPKEIEKILLNNNFNWLNLSEIENAIIEIKNNKIYWKSGIWYYGDWEYGIWLDGIFKYGNFKGGVWLNGLFKNGTFKNAVWMNGTFENGTFSGDWRNGTNKNGNFINESFSLLKFSQFKK